MGVGTGRLAIPLSKTGVRVTGVDNAAAMLEELHTKPSRGQLDTVCDDVRTVRLGCTFDVVYFAMSTISAFTTAEDQLAVFATAAVHLEPRAVFVLEAMCPPRDLPHGGMIAKAETVAEDRTTLVTGWHDTLAQTIDRRTVSFTPAGMKVATHKTRYLHVSEADLMARCHGLRKIHRWANWQQAPFAATSQLHVSVYERVPAQGRSQL